MTIGHWGAEISFTVSLKPKFRHLTSSPHGRWEIPLGWEKELATHLVIGKKKKRYLLGLYFFRTGCWEEFFLLNFEQEGCLKWVEIKYCFCNDWRNFCILLLNSLKWWWLLQKMAQLLYSPKGNNLFIYFYSWETALLKQIYDFSLGIIFKIWHEMVLMSS